MLLPVVLVFVAILVNDRALMGRHANGRWRNVLAWGAVGLVALLDTVLIGAGVLGVLGVDLA